MSKANNDSIPNHTVIFSHLTKEEVLKLDTLRKQYFKDGGKIKDYGMNTETNDYKLKKDK
jgi:hypothetical protein